MSANPMGAADTERGAPQDRLEAKPLGTVEAADDDEAIAKAAEQFKVIASKLIAVRRR